MARDHHSAASLVGQFSAKTHGRMREWFVAVQRQTGAPYVTHAANIGFVNNLYATPGHSLPTVDGVQRLNVTCNINVWL
jgi:hypothetical protein